MKKIVFLVLALWIWPSAAWGLGPTVDDFLTDLANTRPRLEALEAVYDASFPNAGPDRESGENVHVLQTVFYRAPDRIRLNLSWADRVEVFLAAGHSTLVFVGDLAVDTPWPQPYLLYRLLLEPHKEDLVGLLEDFEFNLDEINLSPTRETIVLGANWGDLDPPQAWFKKNDLSLVRLILPAGGGRNGYDIKISDYRSHEGNILWPDKLTVRLDSGSAVQLVLKTISVNPRIEPEPFDLEEIRQTVAPAPDSEQKAAQHPDLKDIRKKMEWLEEKIK